MPKKQPDAPKLSPLRYGSPYCENCRERLRPGWLVAWVELPDMQGRWHKTVFCAACWGDRRRGEQRR